MAETAVIDTSKENQGPSIQESHDALVKEGVIPADDEAGKQTETQGEFANTQGQTEGVSQGEDSGADGENDRPSWLPEKFKTPEDMAKAYAELEKKQSGSAKETEGEQEVTQDEAEEAAEEAAQAAGLNLTELSKEYDETGDISKESRKALNDAGITDEYIDAYIKGFEAQTQLYEQNVHKVAGGEEAYQELIEWGGDNLSDAEIDAFDKAVNSGDVTQASIAVKGLMAQMQLANGVDPERQVEGKGQTSNSVYESQAQVEADMNDPRYETDPAFRQKVYAKMARSNI